MYVCVCVCVFIQIPEHDPPHSSSAVRNESGLVCTPGHAPYPPPPSPRLTFRASLPCQPNATHFERLLHLVLPLLPLLLLLPLPLLLLLQFLLLLFQPLLLLLLQLLLIRSLSLLVVPAGERTVT